MQILRYIGMNCTRPDISEVARAPLACSACSAWGRAAGHGLHCTDDLTARKVIAHAQ